MGLVAIEDMKDSGSPALPETEKDSMETSQATTEPSRETEKPIGRVLIHEKPSWKHLFAFTRRAHAPYLASAMASTLLVAGLKTYYAIILGEIFQVVAEFGSGSSSGGDLLSGVTLWCVVLTAMGVLIWLADSAFMALWIVFGELSARSAKETLLGSMLRKEMAWFDVQAAGMSSLLAGIESRTRELQSGTSQVLGFLICDTFIALACLIVAFSFCWQLTLVLLATIPISFVALTVLSRGLDPALDAQTRSLGHASKYVTAAISAIDLVKVYGGSDHEVWQYLQAIRKAAKSYLVQARCNCLQMGYIKLWMMSLFVVGFWLALYLVNKGSTTAGNAVTTFYAVLIAFEAAESVGPQWLVLAKAMSAGLSLKATASDFQDGREVRKIQGYHEPATCVGRVEIRDVTFAYPTNPDKMVLCRSSFSFPAGEIAFVVGRSGSGKSTLGNLLIKLYEPETGHGDILVDGNPLRILDDDWVRSNVTLIQQSSILFNDTLSMNVAFGHRDPLQVSVDEIKSACETALLLSTVSSLSEGLQTMVGSGGYSLSGGQKQRLALARARLRDPPILILDEVTSGLDPISRTLIMEAIRIWRRGKTTIIITHDLSQIQDHDSVYVMDRGAVVQQGFRRDLAKQDDGMFATLLNSANDGSPSPVSSCVPASERASMVGDSPPAYTSEGHFARFLHPTADEQDIPGGVLFNRMSLDLKHRLYLVFGIIFSLMVAACNPAFSFLFARLLQSFWATADRMEMGRKWAIYLIAVAVVDTASIFSAHYLMEAAGQAWVNSLRTEALKRILRQPKAWFDRPENDTGRIVECLDRNAEETRNLVGRFVPVVIMVAAMVLAALVWALAISWRLTLVALSAAPAVYAATRASSVVSEKWEARCNTAAEASSAIFTEIFTHVRVVRALTLEAFFTAKHARSAHAAFALGVHRGVYTGIFYGLYQAMSFWLTALVFWYGTVLLTRADGGIGVAGVMQVVNLLLFSMGTATVMLGSIPQIAQSKATAAQLLLYAGLDYGAGHEHRGERRTLTPLPVRVDGLRFAYSSRPDNVVLRGVDLQVEAGECVAICGSSGCGKSTLASLLLRLYGPASDTQSDIDARSPLSFNHIPASELDTAFLRAHMAYVPQQPFLFPASVYDNIVYGLHDDSPLRGMSSVRRAALAAGIHDLVVSLPEGYHTRVGEGGIALSGGQMQRVCVARALVRRPGLLVLDEPTSALDAESAEGVRAAIQELMARGGERGDMAVVIVTHSREMMRMADRIVVLEEGRVVEQGRYEELLPRQGKFATLVNAKWELDAAKEATASPPSRRDTGECVSGSVEAMERQMAVAREETICRLHGADLVGVRGSRKEPDLET
ncbi:Alpha-factor-transporting ATPase [Pleurostoma richardsiae]|uniref:Alpha-factor-transporting ATPase n=1 Tax=Pleurostoma richardsiae TaxID=41990 RepID=A0AA38S6U9_9PEZI|nr:Alpha-factor-transporting ATPase [Pleurostoma richardsiae]